MVDSFKHRMGAALMSSPARVSGKVSFGEFELNLETAELRRNGHESILPGQPFQILATLLDRPGQLVTREELKKQLWPSDTFVDFDVSLNKARPWAIQRSIHSSSKRCPGKVIGS